MTVRPHTGITVDLRRGWRFMLARRRKAIAYVVAVTSALLAQGLIPAPYSTIVAVLLAAGGFGVVHQVGNARK